MAAYMAANQSIEENMQEVVADRAGDLRWTKTAYFRAGLYVDRLATIFDLLVLISTGALTAVLLQGWISIRGQLLLSAVATTFSLVSLVWDLDTLANEYKKNGEMYNSLLKEFEEFYHLILLNDAYTVEEKQNELEKLAEQHRNLNEMTTPPSDWIYKRISEDDLGGTKDFDRLD